MTTLEKTLRWVVIIGIFALPFIPLIVTQSLFFPYITGKNFWFRVIVEIITGTWLALALTNPKYRPRRSWILGVFSLFVLVIAIADFQGANPFKSFLSNYERMDGWITIAHLLCYIVVASVMMNTENLWRRLWQLSLGVSIFLSVYGLLQVAGNPLIGGRGSAGLQSRIDGTFGNPIYFAAYMLFHIFIAALLCVQTYRERKSGTRLAPTIFYVATILFDTVTLLFTGTRGTIVGLVAGVLVSAVILVLMLQTSPKAWRAAVGAVVGIFILIGGFYMIRTQAWVQQVGFLNRLATISLNDATTKSRFINWSIAWNGVQERPILGWGQENYAIVFDKYYDPQMYAQEPWFDRVHNIIFDWLVAGGFLGLLTYLSIFVAVLLSLWRYRAFTIEEQSIFTGLLVAYFIHNFFVFDNVTSYILFGTVLAYIIWRVSETRKSKPILLQELVSTSTLPFVAVGAALIVWGLAWEINALPLAQNRALLQALAPHQEGVLANLSFFQKAISYGSLGTQEAREQLAQGATQISQTPNVPIETKQKFLDIAVTEMMKQEKVSPLDARFPLFVGIVFDAYGDYAHANTALQRAHELSPKKQSIMYELAMNAQARGDTAGSLQLLKDALALAPENTRARLYYAAAAIRAKQDSLAESLLAPLIPTGEAADQQIAAAYANRGLYAKIASIWEAHVAKSPEDYQSYMTLAAAYYAGGNAQKAIQVLELLKQRAPQSASQADALIAEIRTGKAQLSQ